MRTIKFRGCTRKDNKWFYGNLSQFDGGGCAINDITVGPDTVGQFTGAIDRNGKEIYEGDIVLAKSAGEHRKCQVVYAEHSCNFILYTKIGPWFMRGEIDSMLEVIGNIHDNPELIK